MMWWRAVWVNLPVTHPQVLNLFVLGARSASNKEGFLICWNSKYHQDLWRTNHPQACHWQLCSDPLGRLSIWAMGQTGSLAKHNVVVSNMNIAVWGCRRSHEQTCPPISLGRNGGFGVCVGPFGKYLLWYIAVDQLVMTSCRSTNDGPWRPRISRTTVAMLYQSAVPGTAECGLYGPYDEF